MTLQKWFESDNRAINMDEAYAIFMWLVENWDARSTRRNQVLIKIDLTLLSLIVSIQWVAPIEEAEKLLVLETWKLTFFYHRPTDRITGERKAELSGHPNVRFPYLPEEVFMTVWVTIPLVTDNDCISTASGYYVLIQARMVEPIEKDSSRPRAYGRGYSSRIMATGNTDARCIQIDQKYSTLHTQHILTFVLLVPKHQQLHNSSIYTLHVVVSCCEFFWDLGGENNQFKTTLTRWTRVLLLRIKQATLRRSQNFCQCDTFELLSVVAFLIVAAAKGPVEALSA